MSPLGRIFKPKKYEGEKDFNYFFYLYLSIVAVFRGSSEALTPQF